MTNRPFEELAAEAYKTLAEGMGFEIHRAPSGKAIFLHRLLKPCPNCGGRACIEPSMYVQGKWLAICLKCAMRTVLVSSPGLAIKAWNAEKHTRDSTISRGKLTKTTMTDIGAMNLTEALKRDAVRDLIQAEAHGGLDTEMAKQAAWFINNQKVVDDIVAGNRRKELVQDDMRTKRSHHKHVKRDDQDSGQQELGEE